MLEKKRSIKNFAGSGYVHGKAPVKGNSIKNDIVDAKLSPGEIVIDRETIAEGPKSIVAFVMDELKDHHPDYKTHFDYGGTPTQDPSKAKGIAAGVNHPTPPLSNITNEIKSWFYEGGIAKRPLPMAHGGTVNHDVSPDNTLNHYLPDEGILGGTVYLGSTDELFLFGEYCFDIDKARAMVGKQSNAQIEVSQNWIDKIKIDPDDAMKSKSKNPIFIAQLHTPNGLKPLLIDGNHRMFKAIRKNDKLIAAYVFSPEQTSALFVPKPEGLDHPQYGSMNIAHNYANGGTVQYFFNGGTVDFQPLEQPQKIDFQPAEKQPETSLGDKFQTGLENFGNTISLGYLPQLQASASTGDFSGPEYVKERDANIARMAQESERNPKSAMAGTVGGLVSGSALLPGGPAVKGIAANVGKGALMGAGYAAAQNPGDVAGAVDPLQLSERAENIPKGAAIGGAVGLGAGMIQKGAAMLQNSADAAQEMANTQAVRASGGMLKDFRKLNSKDMVDDVGKFALDNKIVEAGDSVHDVAEKADAFRKQAGQNLSSIYSEAQSAVEANKAARAVDVTPGAPKQIGEAPIDASARGFNPVKSRDEILASVEKSMGDNPDKRTALRTARSYLDQLQETYGDQTLDPKIANNIKTELDKQINYNRNPLTKNPAKEQVFSTMRDYVNKSVANHLEDLGKATGNPDLANKLKDANKAYGYAKQLQNMSEDRVSRETANRMFGLTDTIAAGAGGIAGLAEGAAMGHPVEGGLVGLGAGLVNKAARTYGPSVLAGAANAAVPVLNKTLVPVGNALSKIPTQGLERAAIQGASNNYQSSGGYQKWYADGINNLTNHADNPDDKKMIQGMRSQLLADPRGQQLLMEASTLKPGSKRLNRVLQDIKGLQK